MVKLRVRSGESIQEAVRRFRKLCERSGLRKEMRRKAYYEKPSETAAARSSSGSARPARPRSESGRDSACPHRLDCGPRSSDSSTAGLIPLEGFAMSAVRVDDQPDPDECRDIRELIAEVIDQPKKWMNTPHALLGGKKPRELIGTDLEEVLRGLVRAIKIGMPT